jgi:putative heme iron utilization protein
MNEDHRDAIRLYATKLHLMPDGEWRATGCDPDGMDLRAGALRARLVFPQKVRSGGELRKVLVELAAKARGLA